MKAKLVPSFAGKHEGWPKIILTGHTRLMKAVRDMGLRTMKGKTLVLECQVRFNVSLQQYILSSNKVGITCRDLVLARIVPSG